MKIPTAFISSLIIMSVTNSAFAAPVDTISPTPREVIIKLLSNKPKPQNTFKQKVNKVLKNPKVIKAKKTTATAFKKFKAAVHRATKP